MAMRNPTELLKQYFRRRQFRQLHHFPLLPRRRQPPQQLPIRHIYLLEPYLSNFLLDHYLLYMPSELSLFLPPRMGSKDRDMLPLCFVDRLPMARFWILRSMCHCCRAHKWLGWPWFWILWWRGLRTWLQWLLMRRRALLVRKVMEIVQQLWRNLFKLIAHLHMGLCLEPIAICASRGLTALYSLFLTMFWSPWPLSSIWMNELYSFNTISWSIDIPNDVLRLFDISQCCLIWSVWHPLRHN